MSGKYARDPDYRNPPRWSKLYARHCPANTCPASRHTKMVAHEILRMVNSPVRRLLMDAGYEPDHWAGSLEMTVTELWKARARIAELEAALTPTAANQGKDG
jgi:hypothetical protein